MTKYQYSKLYGNIYYIVDYLFKLYNPCKIKNGRCQFNKDYNKSKYLNTCCGNKGFNCISKCIYLSKKGCTVKSLGCKLFMCNNIKNNYPKFYEIINIIKTSIPPSVMCYQSKTDFMNQY